MSRTPGKFYKNKRGKNLWVRYGITIEDYNRLFESQNGECTICGRHQITMNYPLGVDHSHETGEVRGLLCQTCNRLLGYACENIDRLENAAKYLLRYSEPTIPIDNKE